MTVDNISSGFKATGIHPYNPRAIPNEAYAPSELYNSTSSSESCTEQVSEATSVEVPIAEKDNNAPTQMETHHGDDNGSEAMPDSLATSQEVDPVIPLDFNNGHL